VQTLCLNNDKQAARIAELEERVKSLEDRNNKNSRNSSKPPSTDAFQKIKSQRKSSGKPVGGQKGHKGHTLEMTENPDHVLFALMKPACVSKERENGAMWFQPWT
jgi:hypothetical protein